MCIARLICYTCGHHEKHFWNTHCTCALLVGPEDNPGTLCRNHRALMCKATANTHLHHPTTIPARDDWGLKKSAVIGYVEAEACQQGLKEGEKGEKVGAGEEVSEGKGAEGREAAEGVGGVKEGS